MVHYTVERVIMQMHIIDAEDRVWTLQPDYCQAIKPAGYGSVTTSKPHIAIKHMLERPKPTHLQKNEGHNAIEIKRKIC